MNNKFYTYFIFTSLMIMFFSCSPLVHAQTEQSTELPDNVSVTTSPDGSSTTVVINGKPGYSTYVETQCNQGICTHTTKSKKITDADTEMMYENLKKQRQEMDKFWELQRQLFEQQQKMFQQLWNFKF